MHKLPPRCSGAANHGAARREPSAIISRASFQRKSSSRFADTRSWQPVVYPVADTMKGINCLLRKSLVQGTTTQQLRHSLRTTQSSRLHHHIRRPLHTTASRQSSQPADNPNFTSIVDNPAEIVRTGRRHGPGLIILGRSPPTTLRSSPLLETHKANLTLL